MDVKKAGNRGMKDPVTMKDYVKWIDSKKACNYTQCVSERRVLIAIGNVRINN